jgi:dolichyl-phosphate-mannose--protein O-mannosyl transferase
MRYPYVSLALVGLASHFAFFWHPGQIVFDEVHFVNQTLSYLSHEYTFFNGHPSLAQLLTLPLVKAWGMQPTNLPYISTPYPDASQIVFRLLPNILGGLLPLVIYFFTRTLGFSKLTGLFAGLAVSLDSAIFTQTHYFLAEPFVLFFGFLGLAVYLHARDKEHKLPYILLAGILVGAAGAIKWTGFSFLAVVIGIELFEFRRFKQVGILIVTAASIYILVGLAHVSLFTKSGPGDTWVPPNFHNQTLWKKFIDVQQAQLHYHVTDPESHSFGSTPLEWLSLKKSILYWPRDLSITSNRIALIPNALIWIPALLALVTGAVYLKNTSAKLILYGGWAISYVPFFFISRELFLYHYLVPLTFSIVILAVMLFETPLFPEHTHKKIFSLSIAVFIISFLILAPFSYGIL